MDIIRLNARNATMTAIGALLFGLTACSEPADELPVDDTAETEMTADETASTEMAVDPAPETGPVDTGYGKFLTAEGRPEADAADDAARKPADVMAFMDIMPGMTIVEMEAGGGYYTELFSHAVGPDGMVVMQNPAEFDQFLGDAVTNRLADDRLANVEMVRTDFDEIPVDDASADIVTWFLGPHELFFYPENKPDGFGDPVDTFSDIYAMLKPGGTFVALDHAAASGSEKETGGTTHRIDPAIIIGLAEDAGLVLESRSDLLANPGDDYTMSVFDPSVRRQTDRFLLKFRKPA